MFEALRAANVDWNVVAGAIATFVVTAVATGFGFRKGLRRLREASNTTTTTITGASLMDNMSILMLTEAIKENSQILREIHPCLIELKLMVQMGMKKDS